jgi:hypothetical protein
MHFLYETLVALLLYSHQLADKPLTCQPCRALQVKSHCFTMQAGLSMLLHTQPFLQAAAMFPASCSPVNSPQPALP